MGLTNLFSGDIPEPLIEKKINQVAMAQATDRLRRYLDDELGECRSEDIERRLDELGTLEAALGQTQVDAELGVLSALANETRYTLVRVLVAAQEELCVCELNAVVDVTESDSVMRSRSSSMQDWSTAGRTAGGKSTVRPTALSRSSPFWRGA